MAIAHVATEYVFSDFLLKEPAESKYKGVRLELAVDKLVTFIGVGLPLLLISLAFAQEVSVGTQISCFSPTNFSWRQAAYVDSFCWAAVQQQQQQQPLASGEMKNLPLWLHKFFPYMLLLVAILMYVPSVFWRFTAAPHLSSDLNFIMEELDRSYNRAIKLADSLASSQDTADSHSTLEACFKYPLVEQYLRTKMASKTLVVKYLGCRTATLVTLLLACLYLGYYINLASITDEFVCDIRTGTLRNSSAIPEVLQCKLVAVGVFQLLSGINLMVYAALVPVVAYAATAPLRQGAAFLRPYEMLPGFGVLDLATPFYDDLSVYLCFLEENLSELKSHRCLQVLARLQEGGDRAFDIMCLLRTLGQVKTDQVDGMAPPSGLEAGKEVEDIELRGEVAVTVPTRFINPPGVSCLLLEDEVKKDLEHVNEKKVRQRVI